MFKKKSEPIEDEKVDTPVEETKKKKIDTGFVDGDDETPVITKQEKKKIEEEIKQEKAKENLEKNPNDIDLSANFEYTDESLKAIEDLRVQFLKMFNRQNIYKWIVAFVSIGLIVFAWLYIIGSLNIMWLGLVLVAVSILIMGGYYLFTRLYNKKKLDGYFDVFYTNMNKFVFTEDKFSDVEANIKGMIDTAEFAKNGLYKDVCTLGSRNVVKFKIDHKIECSICDCAAQVNTVKKLVPAFVGKYVSAPNNYKDDNPIYIYLLGNDRSLPPTNLGGIDKVMNTKKMEVYSNNKKYTTVLNNNFKSLLGKLVTNNVLVDVAFAITKGTTYIALGYDDNLMVLPLQNKFNPLPSIKFKDDMKVVADIINALNK